MRRAIVAAMIVVLAAAGAGCGSEERSALDRVPALSAELERIDDAVADHRYRAARDRIGDLVDATTAARDAGDLDAAAADRILAAAAQLLSSLPTVVATPTPTPTPSATPTTRAPAPEPRAEPKPKKKDKGRGPDKDDRDEDDD